MAGYRPTNIKANETGLVQDREEFLLPDDAYPVLENAFLWRERIKRKQGFQSTGRLRRSFDELAMNAITSGVQFNLYTQLTTPITPSSAPEVGSQLQASSVIITLSPTAVTGTIVAGSPTTPPLGYTNAADCQVWTTSTACLVTGDNVSIFGVVVVPGSGDNYINGGPYTIEVIDATSFKLAVDSTTWGIWQSGGTWTKIVSTVDIVLIDQGNGTFATNPPSANTGVINYNTGNITLTFTGGPYTADVNFAYYPNLPVMGLRTREIATTNDEATIAFDEKYAYRYTGQWQEFLPGTTWTGGDSDFFWSTNYWVSDANRKIFWVTNFTGTGGDPIRYTDGQTTWVDFAPAIDQVAGPNTGRLQQCLCMLPFRGRMVTFNTYEGSTLANSVNYPQRIRWSEIGNPFADVSSIVSTVVPTAWVSSIRGKGGFLDIPTSEDIISVGFVRDNLVIYCERSTWQLRYTGRSIAPFQIEKVNSELGAESTFSAVQFDTSLVGIGDKGVVECDSFKSERIDIKIPDLVFTFNNRFEGTKRVHGIRDFVQRVAYWLYPVPGSIDVYPNRRLVYNYENDSWAIFTDTLTCLGTLQPQSDRTWANTQIPWVQCNFPWLNKPSLIPTIVGGNQQGYVLYIGGGKEGGQTTNDPSLYISDITGFGTTNSSSTIQITSPHHNMENGQIIKIVNIPTGTPFASLLNGNVYQIFNADQSTFYINSYNSADDKYDLAVLSDPMTFVGAGEIKVLDNFSITSKKFNYMDEGQKYQLGYIDILMDDTESGSITLNVYADYNTTQPVNTIPQNEVADTFFNSVVPTNAAGIGIKGGDKNWQRVICPVNSNFVTIEWTLSNSQMNGIEQESDVQIDAQIIWSRPGGRMGITN